MAIQFLNTVAVDTNVLYVDTSSDRVGIGTTSPGEKLTLQTQANGLGSEGVFIKNIFAGSTPVTNSKSPFLSLATSTGSGYTSTIYMGRNGTATDQESKIEWSSSTDALSIYVKGQGSYREHVRFGNLSSGTARTYFNGNVGIGTTSPSQKLTVNGNVAANRYYGSSNTTYYVDPNDTVQAAYFAGDIRITDSGTATIKLDSTSIYPGAIIYATKNGSTSPPMGDISWVENPGFMGSTWAQRLSSSPYTESSIKLPTTSSYNFAIKTLGSDRMVINSSGNVGIGTTNPGQKLDVIGNVKSQFNSGDYATLESNGSGGVIKAVSSTSTTVLFRSYGDSYILNDLGIGTSSPNAKLDVNGGVRIANDTSAASASNVGTLKYYTSGNNSYVDMCMQTGASTYAWVNIVQNSW